MTNETKVLIGVLVATVLLIVGGAFLAGGDDPQVSQPAVVDDSNRDRLVREHTVIDGPTDAKVAIVEVGDFQCPACAALHPILSQLKEQNVDKSVSFAFRHFPLQQHEHAREAAEAAQAAARQGKFWEYHDILYERQREINPDNFVPFAEELGLDIDQFNVDRESSEVVEEVQVDERDARALGVRGTPTLYVNGVRFDDQYSVANIQQAIDTALDQQ